MVPNIDPKRQVKSLLKRLTASMKPHDSHPPLENYDIKQRLPLIKSPTLLVCGSKDQLLYLMELTKNLTPRSKTQVIEDAGLNGVEEKPNEFSQAILDFLKNPGV